MTAGFDHRALLARRTAKRMHQRVLADILGVTRQAVSAWERGVRAPDHATIPPLADALDCTIDDLYTRGTTTEMAAHTGARP